MWENALEKLKIMNYETKFCALKSKKSFSRVHFVYPGQNASHQFSDFVDLCSWLCSEISQNADFFKAEEFDDPNTVANKLMLALRQLDFRMSFPSQKLKTPHGEAVCSVLEFLTDSALAAKGFKWATPVYTEADEVGCFLKRRYDDYLIEIYMLSRLSKLKLTMKLMETSKMKLVVESKRTFFLKMSLELMRQKLHSTALLTIFYTHSSIRSNGRQN